MCTQVKKKIKHMFFWFLVFFFLEKYFIQFIIGCADVGDAQAKKIRRANANELEHTHSVRFLLQPNGSRVDLLLSYKAPHLFFSKPMVFSICSAKMKGIKTNLWIEKEKKKRVYIS